MMFTKAFALLALPFLAAAGPLESRGYKGNTCNSGNLACCNQYHASNSPLVQSFAGLLGGNAEALKGISFAVQCNSIPIIGAAQFGCKQTTVCCENNNFSNNVVNFGCSPISVL